MTDRYAHNITNRPFFPPSLKTSNNCDFNLKNKHLFETFSSRSNLKELFLTASKHCGSGLKNDFAVVVMIADELLSFKNKLTYL